MKSAITLLTSIVVAGVLTVGCAFEHQQNLLSPSSGSGSGAGSGTGSNGGGALLGTWTSEAFTIPTGTSCTNFQWTITSQTDTTMTGTFTVDCTGNIEVEGNASGQRTSENQIALTVTGTATIAGVIPCQFSLNGTATLVDKDTLTVPYSGTTCLGPVQGTETLRRRTNPAPPPPPPNPPPPPPAPPGNPNHVESGPLTVARAYQVLLATGNEFPNLSGPKPTEDEGLVATGELLRRMIWHLQLAGYQAGRQRNPSGVVSPDKVTIFIDGQWHAYDVFGSVAKPNVPVQIIMLEVFPANPVADTGIPD